jgi:hypothetical protein
MRFRELVMGFFPIELEAGGEKGGLKPAGA